MHIGRYRRVFVIEPATLPVPESPPASVPEPDPERVPEPATGSRATSPAGLR